MINAQQARDLVMAKDEIASNLTSLNTKITAAANLGQFAIEEAIASEALGIQLSEILISLGYDARYQSHRHVLKIKWAKAAL